MGQWSSKMKSGSLPHLQLFTFVLLLGSLAPWPQFKLPTWFGVQVQLRFHHFDNIPTGNLTQKKTKQVIYCLISTGSATFCIASTIVIICVDSVPQLSSQVFDFCFTVRGGEEAQICTRLLWFLGVGWGKWWGGSRDRVWLIVSHKGSWFSYLFRLH